MSDKKDVTLQELWTIIIQSAIQTVQNQIWNKIKFYIDKQLKNAHPSKWVKQVFSNIKIKGVSYDKMNNYIHFYIVAADLNRFQQIKAQVIDDGNQHDGPLHTYPGKESFDKSLTSQFTQSRKFRGRPVVWVTNTKYPHAKRKRTYTRYYANGDQYKKTYQVKISPYWPIFVDTQLPSQFNKQGAHIIQNVVQLMKKQAIEMFDAGISERVFKRTGIKLQQGG